MPEDMRALARGLFEAYSSPISSHIVGPEFTVRSTFVGNSMFEGNDYREFLDEALAGFDDVPGGDSVGGTDGDD